MSESRMTVQRLKILNYLKGSTEHPTADMIYNAVVKDMPTITKATVYRNVHHLVDEGIVSELKVGSATRYDARDCTHVHCVCRKCGEIIDKHNDELVKQALSSMKGFKPDSVDITYKGLCKKCK